jgi:hypothetical protein
MRSFIEGLTVELASIVSKLITLTQFQKRMRSRIVRPFGPGTAVTTTVKRTTGKKALILTPCELA